MLSTFDSFSKIDDCSASMDGGSLGIVLSDAEGVNHHFMINRAISSLGTLKFNQVSDANGPLNEDSQILLITALSRIRAQTDPSDQCFELLTEFAQSLEEAIEEKGGN
ncbi:hypothetical protein [Duganella sp. Root198D2]|uniref:hypothetical protein n=1 Tax=Duganella sp. Root198D2 TaxID=1736489 RepID=UPI00070E1D19|nr:hypothetical protein [Duganella sp. Root198D2]KRB87076.1 hypothetical protein ASE26_06615 [Duganella sp. Root198D2]